MHHRTVAIIGLGYVGLPLAVSFSKFYKTIGFDISDLRIESLRNGDDHTREVDTATLKSADNLVFTSDIDDLHQADVYIITVPTPITDEHLPDMSALESACQIVGPVLTHKNLVIFESTVYPGATRDFCCPLLEKFSGMQCYWDDQNTPSPPHQYFSVGYSPERINPGDKIHTLENIVKVISASTAEALETLEEIYSKVVKVGVHATSSIEVAEAAKAIENAQRDLNIAFVNELSMIFTRANIDTYEVLSAAKTKWNFLDFEPGLVGGHCIGVDPYYLTYKARQLGYDAKVITAGRETNNSVTQHICNRVIQSLSKKNLTIQTCDILIMGATFKENCPDTRNSQAINLFHKLKSQVRTVILSDPVMDPVTLPSGIAQIEFDLDRLPKFDCIILAVKHDQFITIDTTQLLNLFKQPHHAIVFDVKRAWNKNELETQAVTYLSL